MAGIYKKLVNEIQKLGCEIHTQETTSITVDVYDLTEEQINKFIAYNGFIRKGYGHSGMVRYTMNYSNVEILLDLENRVMTVTNFFNEQ